MTEHHYPWNVLEIDETDNKKLIKKAYAVLLKQFKPDEHPEKFKEIQAAYKVALSMRQFKLDETLPINNSQAIEQGYEYRPEINDLELAEVQVDEKELEFERQQQDLIDNLFEQLHTTAFSSLAAKEKLENWKFIENYYQIDDISLKHDVAVNVFNKLAEYNLFQLQSNGTLLIDKKIINYFNQIFDWSSQWEIYQSIFNREYYLVNFQFLDTVEDKNIKQNSLLFLRIASFGLDALLIYFIAFMISLLLLSLKVVIFETITFPIIGFTLLLSLRFIIEIKSKFKRTIGKKINHMIIVDYYGNYCSTKQALIRHLVIGLQILIIVFAPLFMNVKDKDDTLTMLFFVVVFTNLIFYAFTKKLIHDYISKTQIIKQLITK